MLPETSMVHALEARVLEQDGVGVQRQQVRVRALPHLRTRVVEKRRAGSKQQLADPSTGFGAPGEATRWLALVRSTVIDTFLGSRGRFPQHFTIPR